MTIDTLDAGLENLSHFSRILLIEFSTDNMILETPGKYYNTTDK